MTLPGSRPLRVLVVTPFGTSATTGGAEKWLRTILTSTDRLDTRVVMLQDGPFRPELEWAGFPVAVHPTGPTAPAILRAAAWLVGELRRTRPQVVVGNGVKAQLVAALAARATGTPNVWVKHDYSFDRRLARPLGRMSTRVVATVEEVGAPVRRADLVVIHPPVQARPPADRSTARTELAAAGVALTEHPTLVMAGRLVPYKGVDDAISALALPGASRWRLAVIGDDDHSSPGEGDRLARLAEQVGVLDRVTFHPAVDGLSHWLAAFDALAVLTRPAGRRTPGAEGFGMTAFEAMQAGVPVVAVGGGAVARRLAGAAGIAVSPRSPGDVAAALQRLSGPEVRAQMGAAARELVRGHPDAAACADTFARVVAATAAAPRSRRTPERILRDHTPGPAAP